MHAILARHFRSVSASDDRSPLDTAGGSGRGVSKRPARRFSFRRYDSPLMVMVVAWCSSRSRMALAITVSPNTSPPRPEALVAREQDRALLVAPGDELDKEVRALAVDRAGADLVDAQKLRLREELEPLLEAILEAGFPERRDQPGGGGIHGPVPELAGLEPESHREDASMIVKQRPRCARGGERYGGPGSVSETA